MPTVIDKEIADRNRVTWIFPAMLLAAVLQNYYDIGEMFTGGGVALYKYEGPIIYKLGKDFIYFALLTVIVWRALTIRKSPLSYYSFYLIALVAFLFIFSALINGLFVAAMGLRWALPFVLFMLLRDWSATLDARGAVRWLLIGLIACLGAQLYQIFNMPPVFGEVLPGIPARTPGIFAAPNSAAFFACTSAACIMVFAPENKKLQMISVILASFISLLAQSGTGIVTSFVLILRIMTGGSAVLFWSMALLTVIFSVPNLDFLMMREDYVELSGGGRIDALFHIVKNTMLSLSNFGIYTNAANLLTRNPEDQLAPDSLVASWIGNFGVLSLLSMVLTYLFIRRQMRIVDWTRAAPCVIVLAIFAMTTIVFEAFPMNIYLALALWSARRIQGPLKRIQAPT